MSFKDLIIMIQAPPCVRASLIVCQVALTVIVMDRGNHGTSVDFPRKIASDKIDAEMFRANNPDT